MKRITLYLILIGLLIFIGLFSNWSISKSISNDVTMVKVVDTTLHFLQPIKNFTITQDLDQPVKLETKDFIFESCINFENGKREYTFTPKNETLELEVKLQVKEKKVKKTENIKSNHIFILFYIFIFTITILFLFFFIRYWLRKHNYIHNGK